MLGGGGRAERAGQRWEGLGSPLAPGATCDPEVCLEGLEGGRDIDGGTEIGKEANLRGKKPLRGERVTVETWKIMNVPSSPLLSPNQGLGPEFPPHLLPPSPCTHSPSFGLFVQPAKLIPSPDLPPPPRLPCLEHPPHHQLLGWMLLLLMQVIVQMPPPRGGILCPQCLTSPPSAPSAFFIVFRAFTI